LRCFERLAKALAKKGANSFNSLFEMLAPFATPDRLHVKPFNSLFEMPVVTREAQPQRLLDAFNSLFEMRSRSSNRRLSLLKRSFFQFSI